MNRYYDSHFKKHVVTIYPGEFFSGNGIEYISTILGSCISVVFFDQKKNIGGMNHFMLAHDSSTDSSKSDGASSFNEGRFGEYAMELLINDLYKKGTEKKNLIAKVFGGSNVLDIKNTYKNSMIGDVNAAFAFEYLKREKIPVVASNTGGSLPRKIFCDPKTSKVWVKHVRVDMEEPEVIRSREISYMSSLHEKEEKAGDIVWFS